MTVGTPKTPEALEVTDVHGPDDPLDEFIECLPDAALVFMDGQWVAANQLALQLFEVEELSELARWGALEWFHHVSREGFVLRMDRALEHHERVPVDEETLILTGGDLRLVESSISPITYRGRSAALYVPRAQRQSMTDGLTGLPTRELFMDRLCHALTQIGRRGGHVAVLSLDVDRFQLVNDSLGHTAGDRLLAQIAQRLEATIRVGDTLARFGGDEFIVMCDAVNGLSDSERLAERLREALAAPFELDGQDYHITATIGMALGGVGDTAETVLRDSDAALRQAKAADRMSTGIFNDSVRAKAVARLDIESALRRAVEQEELVLHYQPIVSLLTGRITGLEALVRWPRGRAVVCPADFVPVAEETGLILPLGRLVLKQACAQMRAWREAGIDVPVIGVNLSPRQFVDDGLANFVAAELSDNGLQPDMLCVEVTESRLMQSLDKARAMLERLEALGVSLAIDDFGTGYSSLAQLRSLPFSRLKIDQWFVADLHTGPDGERLLSSMLHLASSLSMSVVAEGVETLQQLDALRRLGCETAQGYHFARPMAATPIGELLAQSAPPFARAASIEA